MSVNVRELSEGEGLVWRDLRLQALAESPDAFGSTYEASAETPEEDWGRMIDATARNPLATSLIAIVAGEPGGMARCEVDDRDPSVAGLFSMWVKPNLRGRGVAHELVQFAFTWMTARGVRSQSSPSPKVTTERSPSIGRQALPILGGVNHCGRGRRSRRS